MIVEIIMYFLLNIILNTVQIKDIATDTDIFENIFLKTKNQTLNYLFLAKNTTTFLFYT
jgi:hypothetical protein